MGAQHLAAILQMIGIVFHERRAALESLTHDLHGTHQGCSLPITLRSKAVAVSHQPLHCNSWELSQSVQVLERIGESTRLVFFQEMAQSDFNSRRFQQ